MDALYLQRDHDASPSTLHASSLKLCRPMQSNCRRRVQGLDATAARSFVTLHNKLHRMGIQVGQSFAWTVAYHKGGPIQPVCSAGRCTALLSACGCLWRATLPVAAALSAHPQPLSSPSSLFGPPHLLQLIITHIPARRGNVRRLLAAQGLILVQPTAVNDLPDDSRGCWLEVVVGRWPEF